MLICRVTGLLVATIKDPTLQGMKLLVVEEYHPSRATNGQRFVAVDTVGAGEGDVVIVATEGAAREAERTRGASVDAAVVGIVDPDPEGSEPN